MSFLICQPFSLLGGAHAAVIQAGLEASPALPHFLPPRRSEEIRKRMRSCGGRQGSHTLVDRRAGTQRSRWMPLQEQTAAEPMLVQTCTLRTAALSFTTRLTSWAWGRFSIVSFVSRFALDHSRETKCPWDTAQWEQRFLSWFHQSWGSGGVWWF